MMQNVKSIGVLKVGFKNLFFSAMLGLGMNSMAADWSGPIDVNAGTFGHSAVDAGDINKDGLTDILLVGGSAHGAGKVFAWVEQKANGSWVKHNVNTNKSLRKFLGSAKLADFDGDGDLDIAISSDRHSGSTKEAEVWVFINPGKDKVTQNWAFEQVTSKTMPWHHINDMEIADMDDDGKLDIVCRSLEPNEIHVFYQNNLSSWQRKSISTQLPDSEGLTVGKIDNDRFPDIEASGFWYKSPSNPRTQSYTRLKMDSNYHTVNQNTKEAIGDIDGDGLNDILMGPAETFRKGGNHILAWYKNPGNTNNTNWSKKVLESNTNRMHQVKLADMDNDGDLDAVTGQAWDPKTIRVFYNDGKGNFGSPKTVINGKGLYSSAIIDMDNDGDLDIVGCENYTGNTFMYRNLHSGSEPNLPPSVSISANLTKGFAPLTVSFSATASDSDGIKSYKWTFGDGSGNSANTKNTTYKYTKVGTHTAKLVVTDNKNATTTKTIKITVEEEVIDPEPNPEKTIVDDNSSNVVYQGNWGLDKNNKYTKGAHNNTLHWSTQSGAKAILDFEGTWVKLYCKTATNGNKIRVRIDGGAYKEIDLKGNGEQKQLVFNKQGFSEGSHTISVEGRGSAVHIDYFEFGSDVTDPDPDPNPGPSEPIPYDASNSFTSNNINAKGHVKANSWLGYEVDFENGRDTVKLEVSSGRNGGTIQCRLGSRDGQVLGSVFVPNTGGWYNFIEVHCFIGQTIGAQDLYFTFEGSQKTLLDIESFELVSSSATNSALEAETALLSNAAADSTVSGSSGGGYVVIAKGGFTAWTVNAPSAGKYTLVFDYALMAESNGMELVLNDSSLPTYMLFSQSEDWSKFSIDVELKAGENDVILSNTGNSSIEIDSMNIRSVE